MCLTVVGIHAETVEFEAADLPRKLRIIGCEHAAFAGRNVLDRVEREHAGALRADSFPVPFTAESVGGIFDEHDVVFFGDLADRTHVQGGSCEVNRNNQPGSRSDFLLNCFRRDHQSVTVYIDKNGCRPEQENGIRKRDPGHGGGDDFIAGTDIERAEQSVHDGCFRGHADRFAAGCIFFEILFKLSDFGAGGDPAGTQDIRHRSDIFFTDGRLGKRKKIISH